MNSANDYDSFDIRSKLAFNKATNLWPKM